MNRKLVKGLLALSLILGMTAWGCGGGGGFNPDSGGDTETDGDDVGDDVPTDTPTDTLTDTPTDVEDDDGGPPPPIYIPFEVETSGGGRMTSSSYTLELFISPVRPVGTATSPNHTLKLGPAGIRSHR